MIELYDDPAQMEPLLIDKSRPVYSALIGLAHDLSEASACLDAALNPATARSLSELVSGMNCYYSNLIEGHHTLPIDIDQALFEVKDKADQKALQSLAFAHIEADRWARSQSLTRDSLLPFLLEVHRRFCAHLPADLLKLKDGSLMEPGKFRERDVSVGVHVAPKADTLSRFLDRYATVYGLQLERAARRRDRQARRHPGFVRRPSSACVGPPFPRRKRARGADRHRRHAARLRRERSRPLVDVEGLRQNR
jgi:hypothetical protein